MHEISPQWSQRWAKRHLASVLGYNSQAPFILRGDLYTELRHKKVGVEDKTLSKGVAVRCWNWLFCSDVHCPPLPIRRGLVASTLGTQLGTEIKFSCANGNALLGSPTLVCRASGNWSAPLPVCESKLNCSASSAIIDYTVFLITWKRQCSTKVYSFLSMLDFASVYFSSSFLRTLNPDEVCYKI